MEDPANEQKVVEAHRTVIEPLWTEPLFAKVEEELPLAEEGTQLIAEARCGYLPIKLRGELDDDIRVIALDPKRAMLDDARNRGEDGEIEQIFFIPERVDSISYADGVFQSSICFDGMITSRQVKEGIEELSRVTVDDGSIAVAAPFGSSFQLFYDMLDEALRAHEMSERLGRIENLRESLLSPARLLAVAEEVGLDIDTIQKLDWTVSFESGRDFLHSPLVRETFFPHWIGVVSSPKRDQIVRYIGDAIDTYWHDRPVETNVTAGFLVGRKGD